MLLTLNGAVDTKVTATHEAVTSGQAKTTASVGDIRRAMSDFTAQANEAAEQYLSAVAKVQDASLEAVSTFTSNLPSLPDAVKLPEVPVSKDLPTAEEITAAYFSFTEKLVANQKAYTERFFAAVTPAS